MSLRFTIVGGTLAPELSVSITGRLPVSDEAVERNIKHTAGLGLASYRELEAGGPYLAVVGGGPSIEDHVEAIRAFKGEIWAINGAWGWCHDHGIKATFLAVDPHPIVASWVRPGIEEALLETRCAPEAFAALEAVGANVRLFDAGGDIACGSSTVTTTPFLAMRRGHRAVTFFGCESSFDEQSTHAYQHEEREERMLIECAGKIFLTAPDFYMQAQELSMLIRELPTFLKEESGGLLRAMIKDPEFAIRWLSEGLAAQMQAITTRPCPLAGRNVVTLASADDLSALGITERELRIHQAGRCACHQPKGAS